MINLGNIGAMLRSNKSIYSIYYYIGSLIIRTIGLFVPCNSKKILFVSFGGLKFDDSPKEIYLELLKDDRFKDYDLIWAFIDPEKFSIPKGNKIKINSFKYFLHALNSRIWITNSSIERGLSFKRQRNIYFNTWHGTPIKKMGCDLPSENESFTSMALNSWDVQLAQSEYEANIFERVFRLNKSQFKIVGLPRNDSLAHVDNTKIAEIRRRLNIPKGKKVILYAPTFREYVKDENNKSVLSLKVDFKKWELSLGDEYILLLRAHYDVAKILGFSSDGFVRNVSSYPCLNDLMIVSDILISDYSSIFFDYSILERPMLCYTYDFDEYHEKRGLYFDICKELSVNKDITESELIDEIKNLDYRFRKTIAREFKAKYVTAYGTASKKSVDIIHELISRQK